MTKNDLFFSKRWDDTAIHLLVVDTAGAQLYQPSHIATQAWQDATGMNVTISRVSATDAYQVTRRALQNGSTHYDAVMIQATPYLAEFVENNWLLPLDDLMQADKGAWREFSINAVLSALQADSCYADQQYLIPAQLHMPLIAYRRDWAEQAGIDPLPCPATLDDFINVASRLHAPAYRYGTLHPASMWDTAWIWLPVLQTSGGLTIQDDATIQLDAEALHLALETMVTLGDYSAPENSTQEALYNNQIGILCDWGWHLLHALRPHQNPAFHDYDYTFFAPPRGTAWGFGLPRGGQNPAATVAYLLWLSSKENDRQMGFACGTPMRKTAYESKASYFSMPWYKTQYAAAQQLQPFPQTTGMFATLQQIDQILVDVLRHRCAIPQAIEQLKAYADKETA